MKLIIPDNNDPELINIVRKLSKTNYKHKITGMYGRPTKANFVSSGRGSTFPFLSNSQLKKKVKELRKLEIEYEYSLNTTLPEDRKKSTKNKLIKLLKWLEKSSIKNVTMTNMGMINLAERYCPNVNVTISFFSRVEDLDTLEQFASKPNVKCIVTASSTYRDLPLLKKMVERGKKHDCKIRIMANLGCMSHCIRKGEHANIQCVTSNKKFKRDIEYKPCTFYCMELHLKDPKKFLKLPIIRPEDLDKYEKIGIDSIKLVDRDRITSWNTRVIEAYLKGEYDGNLLELTSLFATQTSPKSNEELNSIDMGKVIKEENKVREYRRELPELMKINLDKNLLGLWNAVIIAVVVMNVQLLQH